MPFPDLDHPRLRPAGAQDDPFLKHLYLSTREDLAPLAADPLMFATLVDMQWRAQRAGYRHSFPAARDLIAEDEEGAAGRLLIEMAGAPWRVIDIALLPRARGRGYGRAMLQAVQRAALAAGAPVQLSVRRDNPAARGLYLSLGFVPVESDAVSERMRWTPRDPAA